ncbi:MAG: hypothetical protein D6677_04120 [Calditrichaeota bacterium]|nr:MAG: hypothetical protein D6677_04120 [Calditrichota bacterium]
MRKFLFLILIGVLWQACGFYSFKGALPSHLKTVAVPLFDDRSAWPGIREKVTDSILNGFVEDNTLAVTDAGRADIILKGSVQSVQRTEQAIEPGETVAEYRLTVNIKVRADDVRMSKKLYDKTFSAYALLSADAGQDEIDAAVDEALEIIVEDIVNTTLSGW